MNDSDERNIFANRIFYKEDGSRMSCICLKDGSGEMAFLRRQRNNTNACIPNNYNEARIAYVEVKKSVREALVLEKKRAAFAYIMLKKAGEEEKNTRRKLLSDGAVELFARMAEVARVRVPLYAQYQSGEVGREEYEGRVSQMREELIGLEPEMQAIMKHVKELDTVFGSNNPWIQLFREADVPDELSSEHIKKWIARVLVSNSHEVEVHFQCEAWRNLLPAGWVAHGGEGAIKNGSVKDRTSEPAGTRAAGTGTASGACGEASG